MSDLEIIAGDGTAILFVDGKRICDVTVDPKQLAQYELVGDGSVRIGHNSRLFFPKWGENLARSLGSVHQNPH